MRRALALGGIVAALAVVAACRPATDAGGAAAGGHPEPEPELEEVGPPIDATLDLSQDVQGVLPTEGDSGMLPGDFPRDLPVYSPASVVDFGREAGGGFVVLLSPHPASRVRPSQLGQLRSAGWSVREEGSGATVERGGETVRVVFRPISSGTELRFTYR